MNTIPIRLAIAAVRAWTSIYTLGLPARLADARRAEIESDLWESCHDVSLDAQLPVGLHVLVRLVLGLPDDLGWRMDHAQLAGTPFLRGIAVGLVTAAAIGALWMAIAFRSSDQPQLPIAPELRLRPVIYDTPPPPPPPPCLPQFGIGDPRDCIR